MSTENHVPALTEFKVTSGKVKESFFKEVIFTSEFCKDARHTKIGRTISVWFFSG